MVELLSRRRVATQCVDQSERFIDFALFFLVTIYLVMVVPSLTDQADLYYPRYILLILLSFICLYCYRSRLSWRFIYLFKPLLVFLLLMALSTVLAINPVLAWVGSFRCTGLSTYLCCALLFIIASQRPEPMRYIKAAVYFSMIVAGLAVLQWFGINLVPNADYNQGMISYSTLANPNFLGTYTLFLLPAAVICYLQWKQRRFLLAAGLLFAALVMSLTRGVWISFLLVFMWVAVQVMRKRYDKSRFCYMAAAFALIIVILIPTRGFILLNRMGSISGEMKSAVELKDSAGSQRMHIWKECVRLLPRYWSFGMGPDNLMAAEIRVPNGQLADKAHNIYLEILITMGVFAFISFICLLYSVVKVPVDWEEEILFMMIAAYLLQGLFNIDVVFIMPFFWMVMGFSFGNKMRKRKINISGKLNPRLRTAYAESRDFH